MIRLTRFALLAAALALPATAQLQVFGGNGPRMASTRVFFDGQSPAGMICVQYGAPDWKAEYNDMLEKLKGQQLRLGRDFWTTFHTTDPVSIGSTKIAGGSYYLGLKCDDKGGFHLLVISSDKSDENGWTPFFPESWKADYTCALTMSEAEESADKMLVEFAGTDEKNPKQMAFAIKWGKHVLSAPAVAHLGEQKKAAGEASAKKKN